jgi:hypothetical protein
MVHSVKTPVLHTCSHGEEVLQEMDAFWLAP